MPRSVPRLRRIAEQILRELAQVVQAELKDPRIGMVTFTDVELSPDYAHATVFFTTLGGEPTARETEHALQHAAGFLRTQLAHRLRLRSVPQLRFAYDASVERGMRLSKLIDEAVHPAPGNREDGKG